MIQFKTLEQIPVAELARVFNEAFVDYIVKLHLTEEILAIKIKSESIRLSHSVGAFDGERLVGFMLLATGSINGKETVYNGGTGVVPEYRGRKLTEQMYTFILPKLAAAGYEHHLLEVITTNTKAVKAYTKIGFSIKRMFSCFKGAITNVSCGKYIPQVIAQMPSFDTADFYSTIPSWQLTTAAIERALADHTIVTITDNNVLLGYVVFMKLTGRIKQIAVRKAERYKGIGTALLAAVNEHVAGKEISIINADSNDSETIAFFQAKGLQCYIEQYEMQMP